MSDYLVTLDNEIAMKRAEHLGMNHWYNLGNGTIKWFRYKDNFDIFMAFSRRDRVFDRGCRTFAEFIGEAILRGFSHISLFYYEEQWWCRRRPFGPWLIQEVGPGFPENPVRIYRSSNSHWWKSVTIHFEYMEDTGLWYPMAEENPMSDLIHHRI